MTRADVRRLIDRPLLPGERWIYSAGFNVGSDVRSSPRIDSEIGDLRRLVGAGARVAILSHQGSWRDGTARHLDYVAARLSERLAQPVEYVPENDTPAAARRAAAMSNGTAVLFGNTRLHSGEECNDRALAERFATLGDQVAVGGFSKAHRRHASNTGVLTYRPGFATESLLAECAALRPWSGRDPYRHSVAVLGGTKREKIEIGLSLLGRCYDTVIPGGVVLNALLAAKGFNVGSSTLGDDPERNISAARRAQATATARIHIPSDVLIAPVDEPNQVPARRINIASGVPDGHMIVDFVLEPWLETELANLAAGESRAVVAGTPTLYTAGHRQATDQILGSLRTSSVRTILLGGDTVGELPWSGPISSGGGSALAFLASGSCSALEELAAR